MSIRNQILAGLAGLVVIAALCSAAYLYKQQRDRKLYAEKVDSAPAKRRVLSEFQPVKDKVTVANREEALGHRLTIEDDKDSRFLVSLYFVECPPLEADDTTNYTLARLARYFGNLPLEHLVETGRKARDFSLRQLETRPFRMITRFAPTKNRQGIYGFLLLRAADGSEEYLSEMLVREGLAAITVEGSHLPYGEMQEEFREHLIRLERDARQHKRGAWAHSRSQDEGGATSPRAAR